MRYYLSYCQSGIYRQVWVDCNDDQPTSHIYKKVPPNAVVIHCQPGVWKASGLVDASVMNLTTKVIAREQLYVTVGHKFDCALTTISRRVGHTKFIVMWMSTPKAVPLPPQARAQLQ